MSLILNLLNVIGFGFNLTLILFNVIGFELNLNVFIDVMLNMRLMRP